MNILNDLNEILKKNNIKTKLTNNDLNSNLKDLGIDSLSAMNMIIQIEEKHNIRIPDEKLLEMKNVKDLVSIIEEQLKSKKK